jgi:hypothetical protein
MKTRYLMLFLIIPISLIVSQCKKDAGNVLPPVTSTGANTFGCLVDGMAVWPRDGVATFDVPYPHKGVEPVFSGDKKSVNLKFYNARDNAPLGFFLDIHLIDTNYIQAREYKWQQSSYNVGYVDYWVHHVYGSFYDNETKNYEWFGSYDGSGTTTITRFDTLNYIISGTFTGKLRRRRNGSKEITISDGRFDINWGTVLNKKFP